MMNAPVVRFPGRRAEAVFVIPEVLGGAYVILREHGWLFGSRREAVAEANAMARKLGIHVRLSP